jgi:hypothetical protein
MQSSLIALGHGTCDRRFGCSASLWWQRLRPPGVVVPRISAHLVAGRDVQYAGGLAGLQLPLPPRGRRGEIRLHRLAQRAAATATARAAAHYEIAARTGGGTSCRFKDVCLQDAMARTRTVLAVHATPGIPEILTTLVVQFKHLSPPEMLISRCKLLHTAVPSVGF